MEQFFLAIILIGAGISIGWWLREQHAIRKVHEFLEQAELAEAENEEDPRTKMRLEMHGDVIYAYTEETDEFLAQGSDLFELDTAIQKRYPGRKFSIQEQNLKDIGAKYHESV